MKKLILASKSPRRKDILSSLGVKFDILVSDADESGVDKSIPANFYVQELAIIKASQSAKTAKGDCLVIGADTIVEYEGEYLGKPKDDADAKRMLTMLSGKMHRVYTGVCVFDKMTGKMSADYEVTNVYFNQLDDNEIESYILSKEPFGKAGGYAIQGKGSLFIKRIEGDYLNVVGLPVFKLNRILKDEFGISLIEF